MKTQSKTLLFAVLTVVGLFAALPSAMADEEEFNPQPPIERVPEGVSTLVVLGIALGGIAAGRKFLK
jgi:hypothetical protein